MRVCVRACVRLFVYVRLLMLMCVGLCGYGCLLFAYVCGYVCLLTQQIFYMHHPTNKIVHIIVFVTPVVEHWLSPPSGFDPMTHHVASRCSTTELQCAPSCKQCPCIAIIRGSRSFTKFAIRRTYLKIHWPFYKFQCKFVIIWWPDWENHWTLGHCILEVLHQLRDLKDFWSVLNVIDKIVFNITTPPFPSQQ